jgi:small conductance mechanosensitive channel
MLLFQIPPQFIPDPDKVVTISARVALTLGVAFLLQRVAFLIVRRIERFLVDAAQGHPSAAQRARTVGQTIRHLITSVVAAGAFLHILGVFGWDVRPLLVGASILGAALAFGAQTLVRDLLAGASILIENQYSVGDAVEVNGTVATVEEVTLRMTRLRDYQGRLLFVPNGEMRIIINHSRDWHRALVDLPLSPNQDLGRALDAAKEAAVEVAKDPEIQPLLLDPAQVIGLERIDAGGVLLRLTARTGPGAPSAKAARELRRVALERLRRAGVRVMSTDAGVSNPAPGAMTTTANAASATEPVPPTANTSTTTPGQAPPPPPGS